MHLFIVNSFKLHPDTPQHIKFSLIDNYYTVIQNHKKRKKIPSLHPLSISHVSTSHILLCNKAKIKRLAAQLKYNENGREPFASRVVGLQRMRYLEMMRSGFISE